MKVKSETSGNKVLRAFIRATTAMYRVSSGEEAIRLLSTSAIIKEVGICLYFLWHLFSYYFLVCLCVCD